MEPLKETTSSPTERDSTDSAEFDEEAATYRRQAVMEHRRLSSISRNYDITGKGYLNDTEKALRRMDSQNIGSLSLDKVYTIMENFEAQQRTNTELIETLRRESKRNIQLKKSIFGLCIFTALLAAANIGTSFAAARLAKDTQVSLNHDLTSTADGVRIGTTAKQVSFMMEPLPESRRRRVLQESQESFFCTRSAVANTNCTLVGEINYSDAAKLYDNFCPTWSTTGACSPAGGVSQVILTCNDKQSVILGAPNLPPQKPGKAEDSNAISFPAPYQRFTARSNSILFGVVLPCIQEYGLGFTCGEPSALDPNPRCDVFANWEPGECGGVVDPCGVQDSSASMFSA